MWRRWAAALLVAGTVAGSAIVVVTPFSGGGAPAGTANLFIDSTPGSCTWRATPQAYVDGESCADTSTAYTTASTNSPTSGATVGIRSGTYSATQNIPLSTRTGGDIAFVTVNGPVTFSNSLFVRGDKTSWTSANGLLTLTGDGGLYTIGGSGALTTATLADRMKGATFDGVRMEGWPGAPTGCTTSCGDRAWYATNAQDITIKNGELCCGKATCGNGSSKAVDTPVNPGSGLTVDNVDFNGNYVHDWGRDTTVCVSGDPAHTECMFLMAIQGWQIRNNRFANCAVYSISVGRIGANSDPDPNNNTIENNTFEPSDGFTPGDETGFSAIVLDHVSVRYGNLRIRNNSFASKVELHGPASDVPTNGYDQTIIESNIIHNQSCGNSGEGGVPPTFRSNLVDAGACGTGDTSVGSVLTDWTLTSGAWNFHLKPGAQAIGKASTVAGQFTTTDIGGFPRDGAPDAGAYEFGSGS